MSFIKKSLFTTIFALPLAGVLSIVFAPENAVAGFKWQAPTTKASKAEFPKEALKSKATQNTKIYWGKMPAPKEDAKDEAPAVEEDLLAPVTMETLDNLKKAEKNAQQVAKEDNTQRSDKSTNSEDVISQVVKEDNKTNTPQTSTAQISDDMVAKVEDDGTKIVYIPADFHIEGADVVRGFGKDVPLVLAVRQIIPTNIAFAFDKNINLAQRVSWNGGRAWDKVLNDTLFEIKLAASEHDGIIVIGSAPTKTIAPPPPPKPKMTDMQKDIPVWRAYKGQTLYNIVTVWSKRAGVKLIWATDYDYRLHKDITLEGAYEKTLASLLDEFAELTPQPYGKLSKDEKGQRILTIDIYNSM